MNIVLETVTHRSAWAGRAAREMAPVLKARLRARPQVACEYELLKRGARQAEPEAYAAAKRDWMVQQTVHLDAAA